MNTIQRRRRVAPSTWREGEETPHHPEGRGQVHTLFKSSSLHFAQMWFHYCYLLSTHVFHSFSFCVLRKVRQSRDKDVKEDSIIQKKGGEESSTTLKAQGESCINQRRETHKEKRIPLFKKISKHLKKQKIICRIIFGKHSFCWLVFCCVFFVMIFESFLFFVLFLCRRFCFFFFIFLCILFVIVVVCFVSVCFVGVFSLFQGLRLKVIQKKMYHVSSFDLEHLQLNVSSPNVLFTLLVAEA